MDNLLVRLASFVSYPSSFSYSQMAHSGLYFTGNGDIVKCFKCKKQFGNFNPGDVPTEIHHAQSPDCSIKPTTKTSIADLKEKNRIMKQSITCHLCWNERIQTLFLPCRHLSTCEKCSDKIDLCNYCNATILGTVRVFLLE